jgi:hypothetical protein
MKKLFTLCLVAFAAVALFTGCSSFSSTVSETDLGNGHTNTVTTVRARTFFDSKSELTKFRASQSERGKQSIGVDGLSQEASGSNTVALAGAISEGAVRGAIKSMKPSP